MTSVLHIKEHIPDTRDSVPAAAVWDYSFEKLPTYHRPPIRTLTRTSRNSASSSQDLAAVSESRDPIARRREKGRTYLLGALSGLLVVIGLTIGVDQSVQPATPDAAQTSNAVTAE